MALQVLQNIIKITNRVIAHKRILYNKIFNFVLTFVNVGPLQGPPNNRFWLTIRAVGAIINISSSKNKIFTRMPAFLC